MVSVEVVSEEVLHMSTLKINLKVTDLKKISHSDLLWLEASFIKVN